MKGSRFYRLLSMLIMAILGACENVSTEAAGEPYQIDLEAVLLAPETLSNGNLVEIED